MKKFLSVVLVAVMAAAALASCSGDEAATTTVPGTTTVGGAAQNTTALTAFETEPPEVGADDEPTPPKVKDDGLEELLAGKISLNEAGKIDMESVSSVGFTAYNADEDVDKMFDTIDTYDEWYLNEDGTLKEGAEPDRAEGPTGGGPGKVGGTLSESAYFYFGLTEKAKISAYVITTGNDNSTYTDRNPVEWTLYGTNDLAAFEASSLDDEEFDETKWTKLDYVYDGMLIPDNFVACGYEIDAANQGEYQYYVWVLGYNNGVFQITELDLFVAAE